MQWLAHLVQLLGLCPGIFCELAGRGSQLGSLLCELVLVVEALGLRDRGGGDRRRSVSELVLVIEALRLRGDRADRLARPLTALVPC